MIIQGASRGAPSQLGHHLARTDTNERVRILELHSPAPSPRQAFEDWQTLAEGTRGYKGLYHANIDPAAKYQMTEEQWFRAVEVLEEELGFSGQPRAVVLHEKNGREHLHVVWARTDLDTMTLRTDSHNYHAHERASLRLEQEFGHELVPGKHAKRDRNAQPELPAAAIRHDEWQQAERGGMDHRARKAQVTALFEQSDSGPAFKAALDDAGYVLVRGDRRDFVIMDADGKAHSLGRQLPGVKAADLRTFMDGVDPASLPSVADARADIRARSKELELPTQAPEPSGPKPEEETRLARMLEALAERHAAQREEQAQAFRTERNALEQAQRIEEAHRFEEITKEAVARQMQEQPPEPRAIERLWRTVREAVSEEARSQRHAEEAKRRVELHDRVQDDIRGQVAGLRFKQQMDWERLDERQAKGREALSDQQTRDRERRIAEVRQAMEYAREIDRREREAQERARDGPEKGGGRAR